MKRFQNILVPLDTRFEQHPALQWAGRLSEHNRATLKIIEVVPELSWLARMVVSDPDGVQSAVVEDKRRRLEELAAPLRAQSIDVSTAVLTGSPYEAIIDEVVRSQHDLVVRVSKGAHSEATGFFGTTSMRLLRKCPCAVWLVRPEGPPRFHKVLAAVDPKPADAAGERLNEEIMQLGQSVADYEQGELHVVHTWKLFAAKAMKARFNEGEFAELEQQAKTAVAETLDAFLSPYRLNHRSKNVHLIRDEIGPGRAIAKLVEEQQMDLVVMGTVARSGVTGLLMGNTAEHVLDQVRCPVLTLKPEAGVSPVAVAEE